MNLPRYHYSTESEAELFRFVSADTKGSIQKLVVYSRMAQDEVYNLAFGDYNETTESIDDSVTTNNNDSRKVLATVAATVYDFFQFHPAAFVYITGSTPSRTRLYQMGIAIYLETLHQDFQIFGLMHDNWQVFEKGKNFEAFLIRRRIL